MPENEPDNLDHLLRQTFGQFGSQPSDKVWNNIAAAVEKQNRRRRRYLLWISCSVVFLTMLLGAGTYAWLKHRQSGPLHASHQKTATESVSPEENTPATRSGNSTEAASSAFEEPENVTANAVAGNRVSENARLHENDLAKDKLKANRPEAVSAETKVPSLATVSPEAAEREIANTASRTGTSARRATTTGSPENALGKTQRATGIAEAKLAEKADAQRNQTAVSKPPKQDVPQETKFGKESIAAVSTAEQPVIEPKPEPTVAVNAFGKPENERTEKATSIKKEAPESPVLQAPATDPEPKILTQADNSEVQSNPEKATDKIDFKTGSGVGTDNHSIAVNASGTLPEVPARQAAETEITDQPGPENPVTPSETIALIQPETKDKTEEEHGIWARDTTGLSPAPPKDTSEIKPPHAIPVRAVEIFGSPEYGFRTLADGKNTVTQGNPGYTEFRNQHESEAVGYSAGVHMTFGVTKKLGIKTGLQYTELREKLTYPNGFLTNNASYSSYKFVTLPLYLVYEKRGYSNFSAEFSAGPNVNMYVGGKSVILDTDGYKLKKWSDSGHIFKPLSVSATAGIGLNYRISKVVSIMLRPTATYFPWSVIKDDHPVQKPYSFGAQTGIRFGF